ncbi:nucleotide sugar dehydrogenase [Methanoplanus limicola]|uniref:UDP-N-acetyl-D-mannosamine dehydrogenase n=1 Tax=Methanoplanus limicola DSM 2279 TaxID=937775 RepID=H1YZT9_9EURY|nr:nucleotide sugar dehydrogenase [Methanoplanus limicola]EHQ34351.1 nucleotide sugar dehydrogenase [Methanoplanus limicola DSM 2279]
MSSKIKGLLRARGPIKKIGVIGMGYVGIPAAVLFADAPEFDYVYGFQRDSITSGYKIDMLNSGESPLKGEEPGLDELIKKVTGNAESGGDGESSGKSAGRRKFECTSDFSRLSECDAITLAIQTPFKSREDLIPDFTPLIKGLRNAGRYLTPGTLVVLESTITPGTTEGMAREILEEESGLVAGEDFCLAHAPERVMVGRLLRNIREHDRIVGGIKSYDADGRVLDGIDSPNTKRAMELYGPVLTKGKLIPMSATAAEVTKTAENTFRDLQIAAANQLALYCEAMGINFYDVRRGVDSLKGEGITRAMLLPGAGVGGHCLTKDTYHLERGVKIVNEGLKLKFSVGTPDASVSTEPFETPDASVYTEPFETPEPFEPLDPLDFPEGKESLYVLARQINDFMPHHMFTLTKSALRRAGKVLEGPENEIKIALLGWAFLANSDDARDTPAEVYYKLCKDAGAEVSIHDPHVLSYPGLDEGDNISHDLDEVIAGADVIAVLAGHKEYFSMKPEEISGTAGVKCPAIVDGRNVIDPDMWIDSGFIYKGIGRGDKNVHRLILSRQHISKSPEMKS